MRILHVDPAPNWRGGERQVFLLTRELGRRGHDVRLLAAPGGPLAERAAAAGIPVDPLAIRGDLDLAASARIARRLRRQRPDVLHLHTARAHGAGGIGARLAGYHPVLVTRRLELPVRGVLSRWKYRSLADHYVALTGAVEESLVRGGVPRDRVTRVPSGVELPAPSPPPRTARPWTVGTLAAFTSQKGPDTWVDVATRMARAEDGVSFVWAGEGELEADVKVAVQRAGIADRVRFPGFLADPERFWE